MNIKRYLVVWVSLCSLVAILSGISGQPANPSPRPKAYAQESDCSIDLMMVLDGSGSISWENFEIMKTFVTDFIGSFTLGSNDANIGVVQFSDTVWLVSPLQQDNNKLNDALRVMTKLNANTNITSGIDLANQQFNNSGRADIPRVIIVLTDGLHNTGPDPIPLANRIRQNGVTILGVAVGDIDLNEITAIAGGAENVIPVPDFEGLQLILNILHDYSCAVVRGNTTNLSTNTSEGNNPQVTIVPPPGQATAIPSTTTIAPTTNTNSTIAPTIPAATPTPLVVAASPLNAETVIAFSSDRDGDAEIFSINGDGSGLRQMTFNNATDDAPAWSPDGTQIAFESDIDGDFDLYIMNADGSNLRKITTNDIGDWGPAWSPDGTKLAFHTEIGGDLEIYTINVDGSGLRQMTNNSTNDRSVSWSPDGTQLVYHHIDEASRREIHIVDVNTLAVRTITDNTFYDGLADWGADGRIVFGSSRFDNNAEILIMQPDGSNVVRVTNQNNTDDDPAWSPNGQQIVFESDRGGSYDIWVINADGTGLTQLMNNPSRDWSPDVTQRR